jgi:hypothetical protein
VNEEEQAFRAAVLALLMHVRQSVLAGESPREIEQRLEVDEALDEALVRRVMQQVRPQLIAEQEGSAWRLRSLGALWVVAGGVIAGLAVWQPAAAPIWVQVMAVIGLGAGAFLFQRGTRAARLAVSIAALDWSER